MQKKDSHEVFGATAQSGTATPRGRGALGEAPAGRWWLGVAFLVLACGSAEQGNLAQSGDGDGVGAAGAGGSSAGGQAGGSGDAGSSGGGAAGVSGSGGWEESGGSSGLGGTAGSAGAGGTSPGECASGEREDRQRCDAESVPYGSACECEDQSRACVGGAWSEWSGSYEAPNCTVAAPLDCEGASHGESETRTRYPEASVGFGGSCNAEVQTRTCDDGEWRAWSGTYSEDTCTVRDALPCGATPHGGAEGRVRYQAESVPFGETCVSEIQTRTCDDGSWTKWSGTFEPESCSVDAPKSCDGSSHGTIEPRLRYAAETVNVGDQCQSETQTRACDDGTWTAWSGSYPETTCIVDPSTDPFRGVGQICDTADDCVSDLVCHSDKTTFRSHRQCTDACTKDETCTLLYGADTKCLATGVCVAECSEDADCPNGTICNVEGWCSRAGSGTGNPYCAGTPPACSSLGIQSCQGVIGCLWEWAARKTCQNRPEQKCREFTTWSKCYYSSCNWDERRYWCREPDCSAITLSGYCAQNQWCQWADDYGCAGTGVTCGRFPLDLCTAQPGCEAHPAD